MKTNLKLRPKKIEVVPGRYGLNPSKRTPNMKRNHFYIMDGITVGLSLEVLRASQEITPSKVQ